MNQLTDTNVGQLKSIEMIKASELKPGNYLYFPFIGKNVEIVGINANEDNIGISHTLSFKREGSLYCEKLDKLSFIHITPEWLNRLHIKSTDKENHFVNHWKGFYFKLEKVGNSYFLKSSAGTVESKALTYVHQVQNLYHALAGEELELKPE